MHEYMHNSSETVPYWRLHEWILATLHNADGGGLLASRLTPVFSNCRISTKSAKSSHGNIHVTATFKSSITNEIS